MKIIIVGGGISGLYAAYKLMLYNHDITILEKAGELGGRISTEYYQNHILENGPMRFEPSLQQEFDKLIQDLDVPIEDFSPYSCASESPDFNHLTLDEIKAVKAYKDLHPAFALLKFGLIKILDEQWDVENDDIKCIDRDRYKQYLKKHGTFQGRPLHDFGLWDTLAHVLSKYALDYLQNKGTFYHMLCINPNAADQICFMLDILATTKDKLFTIKNGSYTLIEKLIAKLTNNVQVYLNTGVVGFEEEDSQIQVQISSDEKITCDHIIFTCQKHAYKEISGFTPDIYGLLNSVMLVKLYKIFIIIDNPPFNENTVPSANWNADKIPCREIHYSYDDENKTGMIMIYGDYPTINYWKTFNSNKRHLKNHLMHYLRCIFPKFSPRILHCYIKDWSARPDRTGVHLWRPGYVSEDVIKHLKCFGLNKNIHICGETYSNYQGFIEGSLRSVNNVLQTI